MKINCITPKYQALGFKAEEKNTKKLNIPYPYSIEGASTEPSVYYGQFLLPTLSVPFFMKAFEILKIKKPTNFKTKLMTTADLGFLTIIAATALAFGAPDNRGSKFLDSAKNYADKVLEPYKISFSVLKDKITGKRPLNK